MYLDAIWDRHEPRATFAIIAVPSAIDLMTGTLSAAQTCPPVTTCHGFLAPPVSLAPACSGERACYFSTAGLKSDSPMGLALRR